MLGGVAGGLAEYSGVDPLLWRVGFVALALAGGTGVLVYVLLWLIMPGESGGGAPRAARQVGPAGSEQVAPAPRSPVARITFAGLLIVVGSLVLLTRFTSWTLGAHGLLGAALLVVGLGLVAAAFSGGRTRRGGLIALGVVLCVALAVSSVRPLHVNAHGGIGNRTYRPQLAADVQGVYDAGIGHTTVDLSRVDLAGAATPIRTQVDGAVGNLLVLLPASADVQVHVQDGMGRLDVFGNGATDGYYRGSGSASWTGDDRPEFVLTVDAGIGNVEVDRA